MRATGARATQAGGAHGAAARSPTRLAIPLTSTPPALEEQVRAAQAAGADLIELRADCLEDPEALERVLRQPRRVPFILTVRSAEQGGQWDGTEAERIALIERLGLLGPGYVDIELESWERSANIRQKIGLICRLDERPASDRPGRNELIISHHQPPGTPMDWRGISARLRSTPAAVLKLVIHARDALDALKVLDWVRREQGPGRRRGTTALRSPGDPRGLIGLAQGEAGLLSRVLARKVGAFCTFAALEVGRESAPGQPTVRTLKDLYRWDEIGPQTAVYGVAGWPVGASWSPRVHNAAMRRGGIDGVYVPMPVADGYGQFSRFMSYLTGRPWLDVRGLSVTAPHKQHALRWVRRHGGSCDRLSRACGAANTLTRVRGGGWRASNTDGPAAIRVIREALGDRRRSLAGLRVVVLGAGGVARAIIAALVQCGAQVAVSSRNSQAARRLARHLGCRPVVWEHRGAERGDLLIHCTPLGMVPQVGTCAMEPEALRRFGAVMDTVYHPVQTELLRRAQQAGARIISGTAMFAVQAALQYQIWHGDQALEFMKRTVQRISRG